MPEYAADYHVPVCTYIILRDVIFKVFVSFGHPRDFHARNFISKTLWPYSKTLACISWRPGTTWMNTCKGWWQVLTLPAACDCCGSLKSGNHLNEANSPFNLFPILVCGFVTSTKFTYLETLYVYSSYDVHHHPLHYTYVSMLTQWSIYLAIASYHMYVYQGIENN